MFPRIIPPDALVRAYERGAFPMADPRTGRVEWYEADPRAVLPLDAFHVPASLARVVRAGRYAVTADRAFEAVMRACAAPAPGRATTWISEELVTAYATLHLYGPAHSVECWAAPDAAPGYDAAAEPAAVDAEGRVLVGGLYGVALGGAFFGESMFSRARDASKVALVHLVERLRRGGFTLLDTQFTTPHLARFGVVEIPRAVYLDRLRTALAVEASWGAPGPVGPAAAR